MSVTDINTYVAAAVTAIDAGSYATARNKLMAAKALLIALPDSSKGSEQLRWDRNAIDELIQQCKALASATTGIQRTYVEYIQPTE